MSDYLYQSDIVVNKFKEKGYWDQDYSIRSIQSQIMERDRKLLLEDKPTKKSEFHFIAFLTNFSQDSFKTLAIIVEGQDIIKIVA